MESVREFRESRTRDSALRDLLTGAITKIVCLCLCTWNPVNVVDFDDLRTRAKPDYKVKRQMQARAAKQKKRKQLADAGGDLGSRSPGADSIG